MRTLDRVVGATIPNGKIIGRSGAHDNFPPAVVAMDRTRAGAAAVWDRFGPEESRRPPYQVSDFPPAVVAIDRTRAGAAAVRNY